MPAPTLQFEPVPVADRVRTGVPLALVPVYSRRVTMLESPWAAPRAPENSGELALDVLPSEGWTSVTVGATSSTVKVLVPVMPMLPASSVCSARAV